MWYGFAMAFFRESTQNRAGVLSCFAVRATAASPMVSLLGFPSRREGISVEYHKASPKTTSSKYKTQDAQLTEFTFADQPRNDETTKPIFGLPLCEHSLCICLMSRFSNHGLSHHQYMHAGKQGSLIATATR